MDNDKMNKRPFKEFFAERSEVQTLQIERLKVFS